MTALDPSRPAASPMVAKTGFRRQQNAHIFSAVAFAVVLVLTLGFSWRDGTAGGAFDFRMNVLPGDDLAT